MSLYLFALVFFLSLIVTNPARSDQSSPAKKERSELTENDQRILENGRIGGARRTFGAILAVYPGFGIGHAVEGRYLHRGWIFTLGELGTLGLTAAGLESCASSNGDCGAMLLGISGFLGFKVWEFVDSILGPVRDNRQYQKLQSGAPMTSEFGIQIMPVGMIRTDEDGQRKAQLGIGLNWSFE